MNLILILSLGLLLLSLRTLAWHIQCWQLREYRWDRMSAWLKTKDGNHYFLPWFFKGILPRPKISGRIVLIFLLWSLIAAAIYIALWLYPLSLQLNCSINNKMTPGQAPCFFHWYNHPWLSLLILLIWERTIWLQVALSVWISSIPVNLKKKLLFKKARKVIENTDVNLIKIGITGSYGKSSTKELLVHLLSKEFGSNNVLYNPANNNTEVAIARLIMNNPDFFSQSGKRFLVIETGAYKKGEIATVANIIKPNYGIITGLNQQHVELFGSVENIREAKFELAEGTQDVVFFNGDNKALNEIFEDRNITATKIPISFKVAQNIVEKPNETGFEVYGQKCILPWPGKFFVHNALLALECVREIGAKKENFAKHLKTLPPLERALTSEINSQGLTVLRDTYSANPDGVLNAIEHLKNFSGKRIFVSIPLRELGGHAETIHAQIFEKLKSINAEVYWEKEDFSTLGKTILGDNFHQDFDRLKNQVNHLGKNDVILLESKLSAKVLNLF